GVISGTPVVLAKPQTFMNLSGVAVGKLARFFKVDVEDVIVVHDELDLPYREIRIKTGGGGGGHRGLSSVIDHLGGSEFIRVRLGIGKPVQKEMIEGYVLERFSGEEMKELPNVMARAYDALVEVLSSGTQAAMNKFNLRVTKKSSKEV
ncbi:MAG: aminoacyl-tRNA hydrolase, partial [Deltaproteobacteria bacterium]|nr:aminoacyl-tRNA hydrolase [Deltaproteobacteria bacterium]